MSDTSPHGVTAANGTLTGRVDPSKLGRDHIVARIIYEKLDALEAPRWGSVDLETGRRRFASAASLAGCYSADLYDQAVECDLAELVAALTMAGDRPFTVEFVKKDGARRTLRGHLLSTNREKGTSLVVDLDLPVGGNLRQVDHAGLRSLVLNNTRRFLREDA